MSSDKTLHRVESSPVSTASSLLSSSTRRSSQRRMVRVPVELEVSVSRDGSEPVQCVATDLGVGGMFIRSELKVSFGDRIVIHCRLPTHAGELDVPAIVRWVAVDGFGVQFNLLGAKETHAIAAYIADVERKLSANP